jgi:hypothetical protein
MLLMFGVASTAAAEGVKPSHCPNDMSPRLCLTLLVRSATQTVSDLQEKSAPW